jgi:hypothetical protein
MTRATMRLIRVCVELRRRHCPAKRIARHPHNLLRLSYLSHFPRSSSGRGEDQGYEDWDGHSLVLPQNRTSPGFHQHGHFLQKSGSRKQSQPRVGLALTEDADSSHLSQASPCRLARINGTSASIVAIAGAGDSVGWQGGEREGGPGSEERPDGPSGDVASKERSRALGHHEDSLAGRRVGELVIEM